ncbi:nuclear transport factor 2 family protein [Yinghuangia sp. YIM S09857]|uniref:nuclear transport factor 2 family protein n=1 Tax=Yinghuangia sp. YIM S09857 TaxID=3436929 RepID=UPI003F53E2D0
MTEAPPPGGSQDAELISSLMAESAVRRIHAAYSQACDDGRFEALGTLFADDVELVVRGSVVARGREAACEWIAAAQPPERRGRHLVANTVIESSGPGTTVAVADFVFLAPGPDGGLVVATVGRYRDRFVAGDGASGRWMLARREMVMGR